MKFTIYGSGCAKCRTLADNVQTASQSLGIDCDIDKVTDINAIIDAGVMHTPALAINGEIVSEGKVSSADEIRKHLA